MIGTGGAAPWVRTWQLVTLAANLLCACAAAGRDGPPSVLLIITDDQGYGDIHAHGNTMIRTPNLDRLHAQSVRLTDFHVDPTCSPTRAALMTGRYSTRTGVWHTIMGRSLMATGELTLAEVFRAAGYRTGMFGKWHLGDNYPLRPQDQGFDEVLCHGGGGVGQGPDVWGNDYFDDTYFRSGRPERFTGYCTDVWFAEAMAFVERHHDRPFFAYLSTNAPHGPLNVDERYSRPYVERGVADNMAKFYGMIENIDENIGRMLTLLERLEIADDTIVIFMTDNGTAAGRPVPPDRLEPGQWPGFNDHMRGAKGSPYDGGHRVPFFIRWPAGGIGGARDVAHLTAHIDVLPTLVDLCGIEQPAGPPIDGASLAPLLREQQVDAWPQRTLLVHSQRLPDPVKWRSACVMTGRWRLIGGTQLFDMDADRSQLHDVAAAHPGVVARLRGEYDAWWSSLTGSFDRRVAIGIGSPAESPTQLHPHDRHVTDQRFSSWHQDHVRRGHAGRGFWQIDVQQPGQYEFELRRWPREIDEPIEAVRATLRVGERHWTEAAEPDQTKVRFAVPLKAGPAEIEATLHLPDGRERGAYFVYVRLLEEGA